MQGADFGSNVDQQKQISKILDAAERLLRHYGFGKTTVADIARELQMSAANIYRFFASKVEIHQAICRRRLDASYAIALEAANTPTSASERLRCYSLNLHKMTAETLTHDTKVHEVVVVGIEHGWKVIEQHAERMNEVVASIIAEGIAIGEFRIQDPTVASECFNAAILSLYHPQLVGNCSGSRRHAQPEDLVEFAIRALH